MNIKNNLSDELREFISKDESRHFISNKSKLLDSVNLVRNFKPTERIIPSEFTFNDDTDMRIKKV